MSVSLGHFSYPDVNEAVRVTNVASAHEQRSFSGCDRTHTANDVLALDEETAKEGLTTETAPHFQRHAYADSAVLQMWKQNILKFPK